MKAIVHSNVAASRPSAIARTLAAVIVVSIAGVALIGSVTLAAAGKSGGVTAPPSTGKAAFNTNQIGRVGSTTAPRPTEVKEPQRCRGRKCHPPHQH